MKTIRLIMMFFIICMLGACTAEELAGPESGVEDDAPVVIACLLYTSDAADEL